jgi:hypothetical protein
MTTPWRIVRHPNMASVTPDAEVRYECIGPVLR